MTARHWAGIAAVMLLSCLNCPASAQPARVEARQVCAVKAAMHRGKWSPSMCERVSEALNETPDPVMFAAIWVLESGMNEKAIKVVRPGVFDLGGAQVRCVTLGAVAEEPGSSSSVASQVGSAPRLLGVSTSWAPANSDLTSTPRDRCTNGAARGLYAHQLLDPGTNTRTASAVLASHGGSLMGYSGSTRERGYGARIAVLVAAWGGELRIPKGAHGKKWARVRELAKRIIQAATKGIRS